MAASCSAWRVHAHGMHTTCTCMPCACSVHVHAVCMPCACRVHAVYAVCTPCACCVHAACTLRACLDLAEVAPELIKARRLRPLLPTWLRTQRLAGRPVPVGGWVSRWVGRRVGMHRTLRPVPSSHLPTNSAPYPRTRVPTNPAPRAYVRRCVRTCPSDRCRRPARPAGQWGS